MTTTEREQFLAERRTGIGGSDAAAVCGLSPWRTPHDVFLEKLGLGEPIEESAAMRWGNLLEDAIADEYSTQTGRRVRRARQARRNKTHPYMICHLDRKIEKDPSRIVEVKTVGKWAKLDEWGEEGTDEIPDYYLTQAHHNLAVTGAKVCDVPVLIAGQDFRIYSIARDEQIVADLVEIERAFWKEHVEPMKAPDAETLDAIAKRYPFSKTNTILGTDEDFATVVELFKVKTEISALVERREELEVALKNAIGHDGDALRIEGESRVVARWKTQTAYLFDSHRFREAFPDLFAAFRKGNDSRPFRFEMKVAAKMAAQQDPGE